MNSFKQNLEITRQLTITDFKLRYSGSILGYMWSLLKPLGLFVVLYLVFGVALKFGSEIDHFPIYLLIGIILWGFFTEVTSNGLSSIVDRGSLIKKIYFPRIIVVLVSSLNALINLALNLVVLVGFLLYFKIDIFHFEIILLPIYIIELWLFSFGVTLILSSLYVRYRDISHIWEVFLSAFFYLTPIIYPLTLVPTRFQNIMMLNPLAQIIIDFRRVFLIFDFAPTNYYPVAQITISVVVFMVGYLVFHFSQKYFAENI